MLNQRDPVDSGPNGKWRVEIITPDGAQLQSVATLVELSTVDGQIGVMPGHQRLVTVLEVGGLVIHNGRQRDGYLVGGGFARVEARRLSVLAFSLERTFDSEALEKCRTRRRELIGGNENNSILERVQEETTGPKSVVDSPTMV